MTQSTPGLDLICLRALITGHVQGVGYRYTTRQKALELGLVGWVLNLPNGQVEAMIEGDRTVVDEMVEWLHREPTGAMVIAVDLQEQQLHNFKSFGILPSVL